MPTPFHGYATQLIASDGPHPVFLDDAVQVLQMMTGQFKVRVALQTQTEYTAPTFLTSNNSSLTPTPYRTSLQQIHHPDEGLQCTLSKHLQDAMLVINMFDGKETRHVRHVRRKDRKQ
jgi:hypothetical protein